MTCDHPTRVLNARLGVDDACADVAAFWMLQFLAFGALVFFAIVETPIKNIQSSATMS
jgi:hypothetical protein